MKRLPTASIARPPGRPRSASVAGPPSCDGLYARSVTPVPATTTASAAPGIHAHTRAFPESENNVRPLGSITRPNGQYSSKPLQLEIAVVITPEGDRMRTRASRLSAMKRLPLASNARSAGNTRTARVAGPPSPAMLPTAVPATVEMLPVSTAILRTTQLHRSETYTLPAASMARPPGNENRASVAGPPSPTVPGAFMVHGWASLPPGPEPAIVVMVPLTTRRTRLLPPSAM